MSRQIYDVCQKSLFALVLSLLIAFPALAQSTAATAAISGIVLDDSGAVIQNASVKLINVQTGTESDSKTNNDGNFGLPSVMPGYYTLQIDRDGFATTQIKGIVLTVGETRNVLIRLKVGATSETVTVDGSGLTLNTTDASVSTLVNRQFVEDMPLNGRSFQDLISMTPGVVTASPQSGSSRGYSGDFSVNGQRTESNYYTVDGVSANTTPGIGDGQPGAGTGGALGGATALGTTQSIISVDALEQFRVQTSTYSAAYGHSPGAQFSFVTLSGTNDFHGTVSDYLRNNYFDANDWFNDYYQKPIPALRQNDFGGTFGGPIRIPHLYNGKNRTFLFASYEGLRLSQPTEAQIQYVPDNFMRQQAVSIMQPILNSFPIQNGIDYGTSANPSLAQFIATYSLPSSIDSTSIRVDHTFNPKLAVFFRYSYTPSFSSSRLEAVLTKAKADIRGFTAGATSQLTSKLNNSLRAGYDRTNFALKGTNDNFAGATPINLADAFGMEGFPNAFPIVYFLITGIEYFATDTFNSETLGRQYNVVDNMTYTHGNHQLSFGVDYRRIKSPLRPGTPEAFAEYFTTGELLTNTALASVIFINKPSTPIFNETGAYVNDDWRVSRSVSISAGLRYEVMPAPREQHGDDAYTLTGSLSNPSSLALAPQGTPLYKTTWYNISPRLGAAWLVHNTPNHETVVRGGGGVFYDSLNQAATAGYFGLGFDAFTTSFFIPLPYTKAQLSVPISVAPPYTSAAIYAFPSHMQLPYTLQWSGALQQGLGKSQALTITYVGSNGRRLIGRQEFGLLGVNPNFSSVIYFPTGITSSYNALQLQYQRSIAKGLQILAAYTWSHSIDFGSTSAALPLQRASSDYDVRENLQAGFTWKFPKFETREVTSVLVNGWGVDARFMARTAYPVNITGLTFADPATGEVDYAGVDLVPGQPLYVYGSQYPGRKALNPAAFVAPASGIAAGNAPRNIVRGFGEEQINVSVHRNFPLFRKTSLEFRADEFNLLNHPNFGYIDTEIGDLTFGRATQMLNSSLGTVASQYQQGGPRSMQFALKLKF